MTKEEKALAYDEALRKIRPLYERAKKEDCPIWSTYEYIFPELAENEDEKIRRQLINVCNDYLNGDYSAKPCLKDIRWLKNLLEKQKEQKPTNSEKPKEWSEEDREMLTRCVAAIPVQGDEILPTSYLNKLRNWLESLPERFNLQSKQEWDKEDRKDIREAVDYLRKYATNCVQGGYTQQYVLDLADRIENLSPQSKQEWSKKEKENLDKCCAVIAQPDTFFDTYFRQKCLDFLFEISKKFSLPPKQEWSEEDENNLNKLLQWDGIPLGLRSWVSGLPEKVGTRPSWKPSEEQIEALKDVAYGTYQNGDGPALRELYEQLKKLM